MSHKLPKPECCRPEDKAAKKARLLGEAEAREKGAESDKKKPVVVKYGINHITTLVENGKAQVGLLVPHNLCAAERCCAASAKIYVSASGLDGRMTGPCVIWQLPRTDGGE